MSKIQFSLDYLQQYCVDFKIVLTNEDWKSFKKRHGQYVYLIIWDESHDIFSWGTTSGKSDRIRKSSLLNNKLTGKYDRRVDYLMLKIILGNPIIYIFEMPHAATIFENSLKQHFKQLHCWIGLPGKDRSQISKGIIQEFKKTSHYLNLSVIDKEEFEYYLNDVFFAMRVHPKNPKRTFHWGDRLEPKFLQFINCGHFEKTIEKILNVKF